MKAKKYQNGGKAPEGQSKQERMYLEIRKDAERMEKEMKRQGMSQAEINKKLDAYMEKAMSQAQYSKKKSYQKGGKVHTDELGRKGHFNPYTKRTKGSNNRHSPIDSEYSEDYQNKMVRSGKNLPQRIGYQEERMRSRHKSDAIMGNRAKAYKSRENNFGIEKPKAKVMKSGGKVVKYQSGNKFDPTPDPNTRRKLGSPGYEKGTDYSGVDKKPTAKEMLDSYETKRLRSALQAMKYPANKMSLAEMQKVSKKEGIYDKNRGLAREDYQKWLAKNR